LMPLLAALFACNSNAQEYRGRIQGTVTDSSRAAVAGATVTLNNTQTGVPSTRQTNESGHYLFDLVEPGVYKIVVELSGFNKFVQENVSLQQRADVSVDIQLKPGDVRETITVAGEAAIVQFNTAKLETTVDSKLTSTLPQIYRTPFLLATLD